MEIVTLDPQSPNNIQKIWSQLSATTQTEIKQLSKESCLSCSPYDNFRFINEEELAKITSYPQEIKDLYFTDKTFFLTDKTTIKRSTLECLGMTSVIVLPLSSACGLFLTYGLSTIPDNSSNHNFFNLEIGFGLGASLYLFFTGAVLSTMFAIKRGLKKFH